MYNLFDINLKDIKNRYAHSKKDAPKELFYEHCELTLKYFDKIVKTYDLKPIFINLLEDIASDINHNYIFDILREFILFHDLGKLTDDFQKKLDGEKNSSTHADKSFFIITYFLLKLQKEKKIIGKEFLILFVSSYSVYKHHGKLNNLLEDLSGYYNRFDSKVIVEILKTDLKQNVDNNIINILKTEGFWSKWNMGNTKTLIRKLSSESLSFFILLKLLHSSLIASDFHATNEYSNEGKEVEINTLTGKLTKKIIENFNHKNDDGKNFNVDTNRNREKLLKQKDLEGINDLNEVRSILNIVAEDNLDKILKNDDLENKTFFLNVPTGGGKTNLSMRLATKIMELKNIKKMYYVFPFINIIEQAYEGLGDFIGSKNMTRLDSRFINTTEQEDENYNNDKKMFSNYIDNLFFNKPVLFLSHVKFFDMFFRNDKNSNYNFHQLANSVVIIDEIQAYNDTIWTEISYVLNGISKFLNTYFIVMSATLPKIDELSKTKFNYILDKDFVENLYNHNVFKRVDIKPIKTKDFKLDSLIKEIKKHINKKKKILIVLNTVKDSFNLFKELQKERKTNKKFSEYKIKLLNSTILNDKRKEIINLSKKDDEKIILVATQSVEAGVDIDFDIGFRAYSPLDSITQVAGRINRNNKKGISELFIFNDESYKKVYRNDIKAKVTKEGVEKFFKKEIFDEISGVNKFYDKILEDLKAKNGNSFIESSVNNISDMRNLYLKYINQNVHLIEGDTISLFIPHNEEGKNKWEEYKALFENENSFANKIEIKNFREKLVNYSINIFNSYTSNGKKLKDIVDEEMQYGYYYCENWKNYYNLESGLNQDKFKEEIIGYEAMFI